MITFKGIVISNNKRKDGTYNVKIRVTFKGVSRRLPTTLYCTQHDLTRNFKIKSGDIQSKIDELIKQMRDAVSDISPFDIERCDVDWVVAHIKANMTADNFHLDFFEWGERFLEGKGDATRKTYLSALNALERYIGCRQLDINDITRPMLVEFMDDYRKGGRLTWCKSSRKVTGTKSMRGEGSAQRIVGKLHHLHNAAKERYNDDDAGKLCIPRSPFDKLPKSCPPSKGQRSIGLELMQKVIDAETDNTVMRAALDVFVISFALMGANMADLWNATNVKDEWVYHRQKTMGRRADKAEMRVRVPEEIAPFIGRLHDRRSALWLPRLRDLASDKDGCTRKVNAHLKRWCEMNSLEPFTFYAARHTFATLARNKAGLDKALVDEMLCHVGDYDIADIYIERDWSFINEANRKVLALLHFPQK